LFRCYSHFVFYLVQEIHVFLEDSITESWIIYYSYTVLIFIYENKIVLMYSGIVMKQYNVLRYTGIAMKQYNVLRYTGIVMKQYNVLRYTGIVMKQ
jgi:hypothetical protein